MRKKRTDALPSDGRMIYLYTTRIMRSFRQANLESQLLLNQEHAKKMLAESKKSGHPEFYIAVLEGIQLDIASILKELEESEQPIINHSNHVSI